MVQFFYFWLGSGVIILAILIGLYARDYLRTRRIDRRAEREAAEWTERKRPEAPKKSPAAPARQAVWRDRNKGRYLGLHRYDDDPAVRMNGTGIFGNHAGCPDNATHDDACHGVD